MSHNIKIWSFDAKMKPADVRAAVYANVMDIVRDEYPDEECTENGWDSMARTAADIRFDDSRVFGSEEVATKYLEDTYRSDYNCKAVLAYFYDPRDSAKVQEMEAKIKELEKKVSVHNRASKFIGCEKCGSKLSREHLKGETCPLCKNDLRSATSIERLRAAHKKLHDFREKMAKKDANRKKVWVVITDYHS